MSLDLLKEIYLYGNLDLVYTISQIRKVDFCVFEKYLENLTFIQEDKSFIWRFYNNYDFIISSYELMITKEKDKLKQFIDISFSIFEKIIKITKSKKLLIFENIQKNKEYGYVLLNLLIRKIHNKLKIHEVEKEYFEFKFSNYCINQAFHFYLDYHTPYDYIKWTSSWKLVSKDKEIVLREIDIYLDSYFKNSNLYYNEDMENNLKSLRERLVFLKNYSPSYLQLLKKNLTQLTEKLYNIFPYNRIYQDYKNLIFLEDEVFKNKLIKDEKNISDSKWMFSILPEFLSAYLLGFPVISLDIPGGKILRKYIKTLELCKSPKEYYIWVSNHFNKKYLNSIEFETDVGNGIEDEDSLDLCYTKIKDYNQDDISSVFNNNIIHHFSCKEFETILKKEENPYNRDKITNLGKVIDNLKFKKKIKKLLIMRGLNVNLDGTMLENYEEILEGLQKESSDINYAVTYNEMEQFYRPLIDIFLRSDINF
jgi:hypothetical protein